jgi:hypothetical protein
MALDNKKVAEELISYTIVTDRNSIINLLKRNGVKLSENPTNSEITIAVLVANSKSPSFRNDLGKLLSSKVQEAGETFSNIVGNDQDFGFTGVDDVTYFPNVYSFTGTDDYQNAGGNILGDKFAKDMATLKEGTPTTGTKPQSKVGAALSSIWDFAKTNVFTKENVSAGIQVGLNKINADTLAKQQNLQLQQYQLDMMQNDMRNKVGQNQSTSGNTILYVIIGIIAIAGIGFVVYKQTKK